MSIFQKIFTTYSDPADRATLILAVTLAKAQVPTLFDNPSTNQEELFGKLEKIFRKQVAIDLEQLQKTYQQKITAVLDKQQQQVDQLLASIT